MADEAKYEKPPVYTTPPGVGQYTWVNKPDTKFNDEGVYKTNLVLDAEGADKQCRDAKTGEDAGTLQELIDAAMVAAEAEAKQKLAAAKKAGKAKGKKIIQFDAVPFEAELDDDEDETGSMIYKFKSTASGVSKKTGKPWHRKMPLFDSKGKPVKANVYAGSTIRCAFSAKPWVNPKFEYGVKLQLEGVRVLELVSGSGGASADALGFGDEEDGYDAADEVEDDDVDEDVDTGDADDDSADF